MRREGGAMICEECECVRREFQDERFKMRRCVRGYMC